MYEVSLSPSPKMKQKGPGPQHCGRALPGMCEGLGAVTSTAKQKSKGRMGKEGDSGREGNTSSSFNHEDRVSRNQATASGATPFTFESWPPSGG